MWCVSRSGGHHVEVDGCLDLVVDLDRHLVSAERLDRVADHDLALVHGVLTEGLGDGAGDVVDGDRTEQASALAGAHRHVDRGALQLGLDRLGVVEVAHLAALAGGLDRLDLALAAAGPAHAEATRDEVVAGVPGTDLDDVTRRTEPVDLLSQDELHRANPSQRAVDV